jgi:glycosyltransferase involved in cell wall biosynthesis
MLRPVARGQRLSIAQVTPHPWGPRHEVNEFVEHVAVELGARGHDVVVAAPSDSRAAIRRARRVIKGAREDPAALFGKGWDGPRAGESGPPVLAAMQGIPMPRGPRPRAAPVTLDPSRTLEEMLSATQIDIVLVHDPFVPSAASAALRHSHSLNVGSFHEPTERILSTELARPLVEIFLGRLDARTVSSRATEALMDRYFHGSYELVEPGAEAPTNERWPEFEAAQDKPLRIVYCAREERGALRLFLRALRRLPFELAWEAVVVAERPADDSLRLNRMLRERVQALGGPEWRAEDLIAAADVVCAASGGSRAAPGVIRSALAAGTVPVASRLPLYEELALDGKAGLLFPAGDATTLAGQLTRLAQERGLLAELRSGGAGSVSGWAQVTDRLEESYAVVLARRHSAKGKSEIQKRLRSRPHIECDIHMHTDHSPDCATPVEVLLETARDRGLAAIAVTDHNEISGAFAARDAAARLGGIKVIVGEEIKTAGQGEVIGLFLEELIPRGMTMAETIAAIRGQGGLVYVPHPFDRLHSVPDYQHLLDMVDEIDILEVFNPRVAFSAFNEEAVRFAEKYRIVPGAGSDGHVAQALGSVRIRLRDFEGPEEFLEAMRDADIVRKQRNLVYVQTLKFLQSAGRSRDAAPRSVPDAKPVRGGQRRARRRAARTTSRAAAQSKKDARGSRGKK